MTAILIILFACVLVLGGGLLLFITMRKGGGKQLDVEKYRVKWMNIDRQVARDNEASYHLSVLNADKLLDQALRERGFAGSTMGERMKAAQTTWSNANHIWTAHKIRNQIAHEADFRLSYENTRRALAAFKQALKDVGAI